MSNTDEKMRNFLLEWLINHGRDVVWDLNVRDLSVEQWNLLGLCIRFGYIDDLKDPFAKHQNNRLTDEGMDYLQRRKV